MKKKYYIQPNCEMVVLPKEVLMDAIGGGLAGSPTGPGVGGNNAPQRTPSLNRPDSVTLF